MKPSIKHSLNKITALTFAIYFCLLLSSCQTKLTSVRISNIKSITAPAISHARDKLFTVVIDLDNNVIVFNSSTPGNWTEGVRIASNANSGTPPLLLHIKQLDLQYLFWRGVDNNMYVSRQSSLTSFGPGIRITSDASVTGDYSIAYTYLSALNKPVFHILYKSIGSSMVYLRTDFSSTSEPERFDGYIDGQIGGNEENEVLLAFQQESSIKFNLKTNESGWRNNDIETHNLRTKKITSLSNICFSPKKIPFPNNTYSYHVLYEYKSTADTASRILYIEHLLLQNKIEDTPFNSTLTKVHQYRYETSDEKSNISLGLYRNKLLVAIRKPNDKVNYLRWDNADPTLPWIWNGWIDVNLLTKNKVAMTAFNKRPFFLAAEDYKLNNYGDDLFIGVTSDSGTQVVNLTREVMRHECKTQFKLFIDQNNIAGDGSITEDDPRAPKEQSFYRISYPGITELGYNLWFLPNWFVKTIYQDIAERFCETRPGWNVGRTEAPCNEVKLPVIFHMKPDVFIAHGIWVPFSSSADRIFEELGHYLTFALGVGNDMSGPTDANATLSGISKIELQKAYNIFSENLSPCVAEPTRKTGFLGYAGNYDCTGREHSFLYSLQYYFFKADEFRRFRDEDVASGNDLLKRKYDWIKLNIYKGVEF